MAYATSSTSPGRRIGMTRMRSARIDGSAVRHAGRIDRHDPVPGFGAVEILFAAAGDAGIVDQHIEFAEMPGGGGHDSSPTLLFGHI